jgi:hypothetical protein
MNKSLMEKRIANMHKNSGSLSRLEKAYGSVILPLLFFHVRKEIESTFHVSSGIISYNNNEIDLDVLRNQVVA